MKTTTTYEETTISRARRAQPHLKRITPKQANSFSRLVQKKTLGDGAANTFRANLKGTKLKRLATEVIRYRDKVDLTGASRGAKAIVRDLRSR